MFVRKEYKDLKIEYSIYKLFLLLLIMSSSTQNGGGAAMVPAGAVSSSSGNSSSSSSDNQQISRIPTYACFQHATKVAILEDKPIILDYWTSSLEKSCLIGVRSNNEKLLVKSEDEYTSPIAKIFKVDTEYIIVTANSVYIVSADISTRRIN
jgi:hypothetical protein